MAPRRHHHRHHRPPADLPRSPCLECACSQALQARRHTPLSPVPRREAVVRAGTGAAPGRPVWRSAPRNGVRRPVCPLGPACPWSRSLLLRDDCPTGAARPQPDNRLRVMPSRSEPNIAFRCRAVNSGLLPEAPEIASRCCLPTLSFLARVNGERWNGPAGFGPGLETPVPLRHRTIDHTVGAVAALLRGVAARNPPEGRPTQ